LTSKEGRELFSSRDGETTARALGSTAPKRGDGFNVFGRAPTKEGDYRGGPLALVRGSIP